MTAEQVIVHVYVGRYGSDDLRSAGTLAFPWGVARVGDTITLRDDQYRIGHVHWRADGEDWHGIPVANVDLYVEATSVNTSGGSRNRRRDGWR